VEITGITVRKIWELNRIIQDFNGILVRITGNPIILSCQNPDKIPAGIPLIFSLNGITV